MGLSATYKQLLMATENKNETKPYSTTVENLRNFGNITRLAMIQYLPVLKKEPAKS